MRLVSLDLDGYRRFVKSKINFDSPMIAIVGPNEAGKTTVLEALIHLRSGAPFPPRELTRGSSPRTEAKTLIGCFLLEPSDLESVKKLAGGSNLRWLLASKMSDGSESLELVPALHRSRAARLKLSRNLRRLASLRWARSKLLPDGAELAPALLEVAEDVAREDETLPDDVLGRIESLLGRLNGMSIPASASQVREAMSNVLATERAPHPHDEALRLLARRIPAFVRFDAPDRELASEYDLAALDLAHPPSALSNLAALAGLDLGAALRAAQSGDYGARLDLMEGANAQLKRRLADHWGQTDLQVKVSMDETVLRIFVSTLGGASFPIAERSDGMRAFVALVAFSARIRRDPKPILLVDEAETHLHYDAQADLIRVFALQTIAAQVIYTTHSAGCLPEDLGTGVRVLAPSCEPDRTEVRNAYWADGGGFSPLLLGMGASVLAFSAARFAVVCEGGADLLLLPALLREATGRRFLGFQVAPGLAEATGEARRSFDLEAARVTYLVDGDKAGSAMKTALRRDGVPSERIVALRSGYVIEDLVSAEVYRAAVNEELRRSHGAGLQVPRIAIPTKARPTAVATWCRSHKVKAPNRASVAQRVLDLRTERELVTPTSVTRLRHIDAAIRAVLGIEL